MRKRFDPRKSWSLATRAKAFIQLLVARKIWRCDIGRGTYAHPTALLDRTWPVGLHIGEECFIDEHAVILTHDYTRGLLVDTRIGDRCRIGARALIMPGITIGNDCHVHPGAMVNRDMPEGTVAVGNPAKIMSMDNYLSGAH